jgi:hypothetical protein
MAKRHFRDRRALREQRGQEVLMFGRIDPVVAAGEHGDRAAFNAGAVRGLVDAAGEPEITTKPASPRSRASAPANFSPAPEALREPTIAIIGRVSASHVPRTASRGGASSRVASRGG